ncbi:MAG: dCMP deaminase family protein [Leptolyngbyaceae bacterium]|nr:dCMP deaminase family protein [Leptolyngbyaceae bacterium]
MSRPDWDCFFLELAEFVATKRSKDPSTKVGAVIADANHRIVSMGYNGFPRGVRDDACLYADREKKYQRVVHAELNAILNAGRSVDGCTLYVWPLFTCNDCAKIVIQAGIKRVVYPRGGFRDDYATAMRMYAEVGIRVDALQDDTA